MPEADKPAPPPPEGILVIDKPAGMTSMDVVAIVRRRAGGVRTGHAGTLDPLATGVLVVAMGRATKIISRLMATDKRYLTQIDLSAFTATDDAETPRAEVSVPDPPTEAVVRAALARFRGTFLQRPPAHSAVKVQGRRAYRLARRGERPEPPPRPVTIHALELLAYTWPIVELDLRCGKGLYVRALARDLGHALGTGGYCRSIRRTAVGPFTIEMAVPLSAVEAPLTEWDVLSIEEALRLVERAGAEHSA